MGELTVTPVTFSVKAATPAAPVTNSTGAAVLLVPTPGIEGPAGPPGTSTPIVGETPTGAINGVNTVYTTLHAFVTDSTAVYLNGLREFVGDDYTETTSTTIQFDDPPLTGDTVRIDYLVQ